MSADLIQGGNAQGSAENTGGYSGKKSRFRWNRWLGKWQSTSNKLVCIRSCNWCFATFAGVHRAFLCIPCRERRKSLLQRGTAGAHRKVAAAIKRGDLLPPHEFRCVDCSQPADVYDHRDYALALSVQPVCWSCNRRRGMGARIAFKQPSTLQ